MICDELKTGVTLIFYLQNVMDYFDYLFSGKEFKLEKFNPDVRNAISKQAIRNKKVALTALSLGGLILLPTAKKKKIKRSAKEEESRKNLIQVLS